MSIAVQIQASTSWNTEKLVLIGNDANHLAQLLHTWLQHEKIGEEFPLINNNADNEVYWLDSGKEKQGYVALEKIGFQDLSKTQEISLEGEIFKNEQEYPLTSLENAKKLNAVKAIVSTLEEK